MVRNGGHRQLRATLSVPYIPARVHSMRQNEPVTRAAAFVRGCALAVSGHCVLEECVERFILLRHS